MNIPSLAYRYFLKKVKAKLLESENEKLSIFNCSLFCWKIIRKMKLPDKHLIIL